MNPFRICPHCEQSVRIVYQDETNKNVLVFEVHTKKDYVTRCTGSRGLVNSQLSVSTSETQDAKETEVVSPPTQKSKVVEPTISTTTHLQVITCPECKISTRTKLNLRGSLVLIEHYNTLGRRCTYSLKSVSSEK